MGSLSLLVNKVSLKVMLRTHQTHNLCSTVLRSQTPVSVYPKNKMVVSLDRGTPT